MTDIYDPLWGIQILAIQHDCVDADSDLQLIEVGEAHTVACSDCNKVFSFGWNDSFQLGRESQPGQFIFPYSQINFPCEQFRPKTMASGDDHNLLLDYAGNLFIWGDNSRGQLGIGHTDYSPKISILEFLADDVVTQIKAKGSNSLAITQSGKAFYWPMMSPQGDIIARPVELSLPPKIQIVSASCGYNFAILVSKNGLLFSFGNANQVGQLGHGDTHPREIPTLIEGLRNERVSSVSCGYKHVVCRATLGKVYTWGWGEKGQLGHGTLQNEFSPRQVDQLYPVMKEKVIMAQAGYKHCIVLLDNNKLMWWGSNATLNSQSYPLECDLYYKIPDMNSDFNPLRIYCSWSKTMSITYITIADSRTAELQSGLRSKILNQMAVKVEESYAINEVHPPLIESISKYFPNKIMKTYNTLDKKITRNNKSSSNTLKNLYGKKVPSSKSILGNSSYFSTEPNEGVIGPPHYSTVLKNLRKNPPKIYDDNTYEEDADIEKSYMSTSGNKSFNKVAINSPSKESNKGVNAKSPSSKINSNLKGKSEIELGQNAQQFDTDSAYKLREIKRKMEEILRIPREHWSLADIEFMKMATEPKMFALLRNIKG